MAWKDTFKGLLSSETKSLPQSKIHVQVDLYPCLFLLRRLQERPVHGARQEPTIKAQERNQGQSARQIIQKYISERNSFSGLYFLDFVFYV